MHAGPLAAPPVAAFNSLPLSRRLGRRAGTTGTADPAVTANAGSRTCRLPGETVQLPERLHRRLIVQIGPSLLGSAQQRVGDIRGQVRLSRERRRGGTAGVSALLQELLDGRRGWRGRQVQEVRVVHPARVVCLAVARRRRALPGVSYADREGVPPPVLYLFLRRDLRRHKDAAC